MDLYVSQISNFFGTKKKKTSIAKQLEKEIVIAPRAKWKLIDFSELWQYRELFYFLTWRDIKVLYKQTLLGVAWVLLQPIITTVVFTVFFGKLAKIPSGDLPYQLFVFVGLVFWTFFAQILSGAANSLVENANTIKKVYFPREILPFSVIITSLVGFSINFIVLLIFAFYLGFVPSPIILIVAPLVVVLTMISASGLGLFLASVNVKYRDVRHVLPFFVQTLLFLTPVIYPAAILRGDLRFLLAINPMTGVIEAMRMTFGGSANLDLGILLISTISGIGLLGGGIIYFRSTERFLADIV